MVWFGVPREMLVLFDFGPRETYFPPKLAYASRGGTTALEAYQRLSRAEIPRETLKTMTWLYKVYLGEGHVQVLLNGENVPCLSQSPQ